MNTTATAKIALTALAAPVLAGLAIGLAATASADADPAAIDGAAPSAATAQDTVSDLKDQGFRVVVNSSGSTPLADCTVISTRQDHRVRGASHGDIAAYVDVYCPPAPTK